MTLKPSESASSGVLEKRDWQGCDFIAISECLSESFAAWVLHQKLADSVHWLPSDKAGQGRLCTLFLAQHGFA